MWVAMTLQAQEAVHEAAQEPAQKPAQKPAHHGPINEVQEQSHTDAIRLHKTRRFNANLPATTSALSAQSTHACPYESDIAKKPPFKTVSLTFDDGPSPARTEFVLSILDKYNIPGAFFLIGQSAKNTRSWCEKLRSVDDISLATIPGNIPIFMALTLSNNKLKLLKPSKRCAPIQRKNTFVILTAIRRAKAMRFCDKWTTKLSVGMSTLVIGRLTKQAV